MGLGVALALALAFAVTNGANAIAALVATRAARPLPAVLMAAVVNLLGPLVAGAAVADTIGGILTAPGASGVMRSARACSPPSPGTPGPGRSGCPRALATR